MPVRLRSGMDVRGVRAGLRVLLNRKTCAKPVGVLLFRELGARMEVFCQQPVRTIEFQGRGFVRAHY
jgi:hypothetical protein